MGAMTYTCDLPVDGYLIHMAKRFLYGQSVQSEPLDKRIIAFEPGLHLDTGNQIVELEWPQSKSEDTPLIAQLPPVFVIQSRIMGWKLLWVRPQHNGDIYLSFIKLGSMRQVEAKMKLRTRPAEETSLSIPHFYTIGYGENGKTEYDYFFKNEEASIEETSNSHHRLVKLLPDNHCEVTEYR